ncbi:ANTAR domain-containing protein [Streptomyces sp. NPDC058430]|uniref:ANTAR domain-containing protein n=1 Tax=unclassified Streptomyces TaxID=2593676 RepID=UPI00363A7050
MVDQATGVLVAVGRLSLAEGWDVLREVSMHTNIKLRHVAELLIEWAAGRSAVFGYPPRVGPAARPARSGSGPALNGHAPPRRDEPRP